MRKEIESQMPRYDHSDLEKVGLQRRVAGMLIKALLAKKLEVTTHEAVMLGKIRNSDRPLPAALREVLEDLIRRVK